MKKQDIYTYLTYKRRETLNNKTDSLFKEWVEEENQETRLRLMASGADFDKMITAMSVAKNELEKVRDALDWGNSEINTAINAMEKMATNDNVVKIAKNSIKKGVESERARHAYNEKRRLVLEEFSKIDSMVKSTSSAKKACGILEELGFDVSKIEVKPRNEIATTNVNKELLGLPEAN